MNYYIETRFEQMFDYIRSSITTNDNKDDQNKELLGNFSPYIKEIKELISNTEIKSTHDYHFELSIHLKK
jgi:hypothetical protein